MQTMMHVMIEMVGHSGLQANSPPGHSFNVVLQTMGVVVVVVEVVDWSVDANNDASDD